MSRLDHREHDRALRLAAGGIDFGLTAADAAALDTHLVTCPSCARAAAAMRADALALRPRTMPLPSRRVDDAVFGAIAGRRTSSPPALVLVAAALLLVALVATVAAAGSILLRTWRTTPTIDGPRITVDMSAEEVVAASIAAHLNPPPLMLVTGLGPLDEYRTNWYSACGALDDLGDRRTIYWRYLYDGTGFRQECRYGGVVGRPGPLGGQYVGGFELLTPDGHGTWDDAEWRLIDGPLLGRPANAPLATPLWLNWINVGAADNPDAGRTVTCDAWSLGPIEEVAQRDARLVSCGADRYWVDLESGLIVKRERGGEVLAEALALETGTAPDASQFAMLDVDFTTSLRPGLRPAAITLPTLEGDTWSSDSLIGQPAAVLRLDDCTGDGCLRFEDFVDAVAARGDALRAVVIVGRGLSGEDAAAAREAGIPLVRDDGSGWPRWDYWPGLTLFDPDGTVRAVVDPHTVTSLTAVLDAFLAGQPIPVPPPWDGVFTVGEPATALYGQRVRDGRLTGEAFDLAKLAGRPVVVTIGVPVQREINRGDAENAKGVATIAAARRELGADLAFVVLAGSEATAETLETWTRLLAAEGLTDADVSLVVSEDSWGRWEPLARGPAGSMGEPGMLVVTPDGSVARIFGEGLPTTAELRLAVNEATR